MLAINSLYEKIVQYKINLNKKLRKNGEKKKRAFIGPKQIWINPTDFVCNNRCHMCLNQKLDKQELKNHIKKELNTRCLIGDYKRLFRLMTRGLSIVTICGGGEPLMHPDCISLMKLVKDRGYIGHMVTNGVLLNQDAAKTIVDKNWDFVRVSANAGDEKTYTKIVNTKNFEKLKANLMQLTNIRAKNCKEDKISITLFFVLQRESIGNIAAMLSFAKEVNANAAEFDMIKPFDQKDELTISERKKLHDELVITIKDFNIISNGQIVIDSLAKEIEKDSEADNKNKKELKALSTSDNIKSNGKLKNQAFLLGKECVIGFHQAFIKASGDVVPCCFSSDVMGNIKEKSFIKIWYGKKYSDFRKKVMNNRFLVYCHNFCHHCPPDMLRDKQKFNI